MPQISDLPYKINVLAKKGQYAYLNHSASGKLRVARIITLCDGPKLWEEISKTPLEEYAFYIDLRLFATLSMVKEYLSSPELASYCSLSKVDIPILPEDTKTIRQHEFTSEQSLLTASQEYMTMLSAKSSEYVSLDTLDELVSDLKIGRRGRKKKIQVEIQVSAEIPKQENLEEQPPVDGVELQEKIEEAIQAKFQKRKRKSNLRDQFAKIQKTPSKVIDVSTFGETMQNQKGKILDRMKHVSRISKCKLLPDLFPVISDNIPAFERAMNFLGPIYIKKIEEFKALF